MEKKNYKWLILIIILISIIIFLLTRIKEKPFNKIELNKQNIITNTTDIPYLDTILHVGLNDLNIKNTYLIIKKFEGGTIENGKFDLQAYIVGKGNQYMVYIKKSSRMSSIELLSHELIHLKQYYDGRLIKIDDVNMIWENDTINGLKIPYEERPWEVEAFKKQNELYKKIRKILYK